MYSLNKVLPTLDNIRTELKQSTGYTGSNGCLRKDLQRQDVVLSRIRYLCMVRELREAGYTVVYTDETFVHTSHAVPNAGKIVLLD